MSVPAHGPRPIPLSPRSRVAAVAVFALVAALLVAVQQPAPASAATATRYGVGATALTAPTAGGRTIFVATNGDDRAAGSERYPLRNIQTAIRAAEPGDVIAVRAGTYQEAAGWGTVPGREGARITLQAYPGERVVLSGTLKLRNADYWTVQGIRFYYNATIQRSGQSVVAFSGGTGWRFLNNEVAGSAGVANLYIQADTSMSDRTAAAPQDWVVGGNCIRDNRGKNAHGMDHNIYLQSSIYTTNGLIERNLIAGAPNGTNIKAAGSSASAPDGSPRYVNIRYNTMLFGATGMVIGLKAEKIETSRNIIAKPSGSDKWDAGVKGWQLANPGRNSVKDTLIGGYAQPFREAIGMFIARTNQKATITYTGSVGNCSVKPNVTTHGHLAP